MLTLPVPSQLGPVHREGVCVGGCVWCVCVWEGVWGGVWGRVCVGCVGGGCVCVVCVVCVGEGGLQYMQATSEYIGWYIRELLDDDHTNLVKASLQHDLRDLLES